MKDDLKYIKVLLEQSAKRHREMNFGDALRDMELATRLLGKLIECLEK